MRDFFFRNQVLFIIYCFIYKQYYAFRFRKINDIDFISINFIKYHNYPLNLLEPRTLNEKLQWLKIFYRKSIDIKLADKLQVKTVIAEVVGKEFCVPTLAEFNSLDQLKYFKIPDEPFIMKANHDSGSYFICRDKSNFNFKHIERYCKFWLSKNYYYACREYQYFPLKPKVIVEKLLLDSNGKIPNDYKFNVINGTVEFIYVAFDREGKNLRTIYNKSWERMNFIWSKDKNAKKFMHNVEIPRPMQLQHMLDISEKFGKLYPYIRVDMYLLNDHIYIGEITQCQGGGFDKMVPKEMDVFFGDKLNLNV